MAGKTERKRAAPSGLTPQGLLSQYPRKIQMLGNDLRRRLCRAVPTFTERALPGWRAIGFRDPHAGHVCALFPFNDHVKLYLEHGARLPDPDGLLEGTTKQTRFITLRSVRDTRRRALIRLIQRAVARQAM